MVEIEFRDLVFGDVLIAFDGRVIERFNPHVNEAQRIHGRQAKALISGPNRKGLRTIDITYRNGSRGGFTLNVDEVGYVTLQPLLGELQTAGIPVT